MLTGLNADACTDAIKANVKYANAVDKYIDENNTAKAKEYARKFAESKKTTVKECHDRVGFQDIELENKRVLFVLKHNGLL